MAILILTGDIRIWHVYVIAALVAVMLVSIWVQVGYQMVVFQAGLQGIPRDYLDAARVDYVRSFRPGDETPARADGDVSFTYSVPSRLP